MHYFLVIDIHNLSAEHLSQITTVK